jgi:hypothetical protein
VSCTLPDDDFEIENLDEWVNDGFTGCTGPIMIPSVLSSCCTGAIIDPPGDITEKPRKLTTKKFKPDDMFPHRCPDCGQAAYIGANKIECSNPSCRHAV